MKQFILLALMLLAQQVFGQRTLTLQPHWNGEDCTLQWLDTTDWDWYGTPVPYIADSPGYYQTQIDYEAWTFQSDPGLLRGFIRFVDLSNPAVVPSHVRLVSATLTLSGIDTSGYWNGNNNFPGTPWPNTNEGWLYELNDSFDAKTMYWYTQPGVKHTDSVTIPGSTVRWNESATLNVTAMVKDMLLNGNTGFEIRAKIETYYRSRMFASSKYWDSTHHPALTLVYYDDYIQDTVTCNTATFTPFIISDSAIKSYKWNFGDGSTDTGKTVSHTYDSNGTYLVTLIAKDTLGKNDTLSDSVVIHVLPMSYNITDSIFDCTDVRLKAIYVSGDTSKAYVWDLDDGSTGSGISITHDYSNTGNYIISLFLINSQGCPDTVRDNIAIKPAAMSYSIVDSFLKCKEVEFTAISSGFDTAVSYGWDFGDGSTGSAYSMNHMYSNYGTYAVSLVVTNKNGCTDTFNTSIIIAPPVMNYSITDSIISCETVILTGSYIGGDIAISYLWNLGDGTVGNTNPVTHTYSKSNNYSISLILTNGIGCVDTINTIITLPVPDIHYNITDSVTSCKSAILTAVYDSGENAANYKWYFGDGKTESANPVSHIYPGGGNYVVSLIIIDSLGCTDSISVPIHLNGYITIQATGDTSVCADAPAQLHAYGASTYSWLPPYSLSDPNQADPVAKTDSTTKYIVTGTDDNGCTGKDSVMVTILPGPALSLSTNGAVITCSNKVVQLFATGAQSYVWQPGVYCDDSISSSPIVSPNQATTFYVTGTGVNGCTSKSSISIPADRQPDVFMPSAFTPNGDGLNDKIYPRIYCDFIFGSLHIYNRWGQEVFETKTYGEGWDGRFYGVPCEIGTYYYFIKGTTDSGDPITLKGDITLIR
ncbi:MAG TPA: PKD domain-containing protein [Flavipsychrobacter sp.]|nr:PKD domain-containing protein [Flavipsychrobacter sp.]